MMIGASSGDENAIVPEQLNVIVWYAATAATAASCVQVESAVEVCWRARSLGALAEARGTRATLSTTTTRQARRPIYGQCASTSKTQHSCSSQSTSPSMSARTSCTCEPSPADVGRGNIPPMQCRHKASGLLPTVAIPRPGPAEFGPRRRPSSDGKERELGPDSETRDRRRRPRAASVGVVALPRARNPSPHVLVEEWHRERDLPPMR